MNTNIILVAKPRLTLSRLFDMAVRYDFKSVPSVEQMLRQLKQQVQRPKIAHRATPRLASTLKLGIYKRSYEPWNEKGTINIRGEWSTRCEGIEWWTGTRFSETEDLVQFEREVQGYRVLALPMENHESRIPRYFEDICKDLASRIRPTDHSPFKLLASLEGRVVKRFDGLERTSHAPIAV